MPKTVFDVLRGSGTSFWIFFIKSPILELFYTPLSKSFYPLDIRFFIRNHQFPLVIDLNKYPRTYIYHKSSVPKNSALSYRRVRKNQAKLLPPFRICVLRCIESKSKIDLCLSEISATNHRFPKVRHSSQKNSSKQLFPLSYICESSFQSSYRYVLSRRLRFICSGQTVRRDTQIEMQRLKDV